jgi:Phage integrase family
VLSELSLLILPRESRISKFLLLLAVSNPKFGPDDRSSWGFLCSNHHHGRIHHGQNSCCGPSCRHCECHCGGRRSYLCEGYRAKTRVPVNVVIPHEVGDALRQLPNSHPSDFFWSGNGNPRSAAKAFQRSYWKLFSPAKILKPGGTPKRFHPHVFRDTFAVERPLAGVPLDQVSLLLGHSSVKITERHYAPFFKGRQE